MSIEQRLCNVEQAIKLAGLATKEILTLSEASTFTGMAKSYLYKLTSTQRLPHSKQTGKLCYFNRKELETWLSSNRVSTTAELTGKAQVFCMKNKGGQNQ